MTAKVGEVVGKNANAAKLVLFLFLHHVLNSYMITLKRLPTEVNWPQKTCNPLKTKFPGSNWSVLVMQIEQSEFLHFILVKEP